MWGIILILLATCILLMYLWIRKALNYWNERGIETHSSTSLKQEIFSETPFLESMLNYYMEFKSKHLRHGGVYILLDPYYVPIDLAITKSIMETDFQNFVSIGAYVNERVDSFSANLANLEGSKWKDLRSKLTPLFTPARMKDMFQNIEQCSNTLCKVIENDLGNGVDFQDISGRFTTDVIASCAFGFESHSLECPDSRFWQMITSTLGKNVSKNLTTFMITIFPKLMKTLNYPYFAQDVRDYFIGVIKECVTNREETKTVKKDFLHCLIQLMNHGKLVDDEELDTVGSIDEINKITFDELATQAFLSLLVSVETSAPTLSFCLYELANNKSIQEKAREHVKYVLTNHHGKLTYEAILEMDYLEQIIQETLRKYPPVAMLQRVSSTDYKIPGSNIILEKDTKVMISVMGIHYDPDYYPDPQMFDPERFSAHNKRTRPYFSFLPFGAGPKMCLGIRFGMMQLQTGLAALLLKYEFSLNEKTKQPIKFDPESFVPSAEGGMWLNFKKHLQKS